MKRYAYLLAALLAVLLLTTGCQKQDANTIRIGLLAELTGDLSAAGTSCRNAAEMAVKEMNDAGGVIVGGKAYKVELVVEDTASKPEQAASGAQKLIAQNRVIAIIGPNASGNAIPASELAESNRTILITPWSTNPKTTLDAKTGAPKKYVFRAAFIDPFQGRVVAKFVLDTMKAKSAAVLYDVASDYNKGIAEFFRTTLEESGGKVVAFESYTTNDKDFSAQLTKIKAAKPDVIFLPNYYNEVPLQIQQAHRLGIKVPFVGSDSWGSNDLLKLCGADCEGYYFSTHYSAESASTEAKRFIEAYKAQYGNLPDDVAALTYDAFGMLRTAMAGASAPERQAVRDALAKLPEYVGVTGKMAFKDGSGDPIKSAVILQVKDGKFTWYADAQP